MAKSALDNERFISIIKGAGYSRSSVFVKSAPSTNDLAKAASSSPDLTAFLAFEQTKGKGRLGRAWASRAGDGVYLSVLIKPGDMARHTPLLPLITAVAVCGALCGIGAECLIKWPNDIVCGGRKICGILLESGFSGGEAWTVAGMGINLAQSSRELTEQGLPHATSLADSGIMAGYYDVVNAVLTAFADEYGRFCANHASVLDSYRGKCVTLGREALISCLNEDYRAMAVDISDDGALIVERNGRREAVYAGDVSVRGVMGYV